MADDPEWIPIPSLPPHDVPVHALGTKSEYDDWPVEVILCSACEDWTAYDHISKSWTREMVTQSIGKPTHWLRWWPTSLGNPMAHLDEGDDNA